MGRIYHDEDNALGQRALVWIECDSCAAKERPGSEALLQDWVMYGAYRGPGHSDNCTNYACTDCRRVLGL
jgi:hypothetical protein